MRYILFILLSFFSIQAMGQNCNLLVDRTVGQSGGFIKTTREEVIYQQTGRRLKFYLENLDGEYALAVNWYISPKVLDAKEVFDPKKPLLLTITLANGDKVSLTVLEPSPGGGTVKLKYADYMIGGLIPLPLETREKLLASPIVSITEGLYGTAPVTLSEITTPDFFQRMLPCIAQ